MRHYLAENADRPLELGSLHIGFTVISRFGTAQGIVALEDRDADALAGQLAARGAVLITPEEYAAKYPKLRSEVRREQIKSYLKAMKGKGEAVVRRDGGTGRKPEEAKSATLIQGVTISEAPEGLPDPPSEAILVGKPKKSWGN